MKVKGDLKTKTTESIIFLENCTSKLFISGNFIRRLRAKNVNTLMAVISQNLYQKNY